MSSRTLEKCVAFTEFCNLHKVSPAKVAEAMETCLQITYHKGWNHKQRTREKATQQIEALGFTEVSFLNSVENRWPTFVGKDGGIYQFPDVGRA